MGRRLVGTVALLNPSTFTTEVFGPGDTVPAWAASRITNPALFADDESDAGSGGSGEPPRAGKGSSRDAWATYAEQVGVDVPDGASRDDIIAAVDGRA